MLAALVWAGCSLSGLAIAWLSKWVEYVAKLQAQVAGASGSVIVIGNCAKCEKTYSGLSALLQGVLASSSWLLWKRKWAGGMHAAGDMQLNPVSGSLGAGKSCHCACSGSTYLMILFIC